jgi:hypothetical protein
MSSASRSPQQSLLLLTRLLMVQGGIRRGAPACH